MLDALGMLFKRIDGYFNARAQQSTPGTSIEHGVGDFMRGLAPPSYEGPVPMPEPPWSRPPQTTLPPGGGVLLPKDVRPSGTVGAPDQRGQTPEDIARKRDMMNMGLAALQAAQPQPDRWATGYMPSYQNVTPTGFTELMRLTQLPGNSVQMPGLRY